MLKELTEEDVTKDIKWEHRRIRSSDTWEALKISFGTGKPNKVSVIIQALHIDLNTQMTNMGEDFLPAYDESNPQTTVDMSQSHLPDYDEATHATIDMTELGASQSQQRPPPTGTVLSEYENTVTQNR